MERHDQLVAVNAQLMKGVVQSPLEYRKAAQAATAMACHPGVLGIDAADAESFAKRMYA